MARGVPIYDSGVIPAGGGTQQAFIDKIVEKLTEYQSNGEQAWELAEQIDTGANYEAVFHSVGDRSLGSGANKGDTDLWIYLHKSSVDDYAARCYQDWSPTSGAGYREAGTANFQTDLSDTVAVEWYSCCNESEFVFIYNYGGNWNSLCFGSVIRPFSDKLNGVARSTSQSGTGNGVVVGLDRDITTSIEVGQYVWLVNQTPDAQALQSVGIDLCEVTGVTAANITLNGVTNTYANGSLVGLDPTPMYYRGGTSGSNTPYFSQALNGSYTGVTIQDGALVNLGTTALVEADYDPGPDQLYIGFQPFVKMDAAPEGYRGKFQHFRVFTLGTQVDADLMEVDFDSAQRWKCFVNHTMFVNWVTCIGPGAS